jgi:ABC-type nitrate/sulfonate/bicarbonate transport system substrate-binding protein
MVDALLHDQVDAIGLFGLYYIPLEKSDNASKIQMLFRDRDALPTDKLYVAYVFTNDYIAAHPAIVKAFIAAVKEAAVWVEAHPDETLKIISDHYKLPRENLALPSWPKGLCIDTAAAEEWASALQRVGQVKKDALPPTSVWLTNKFNPACR